MAHFFWIVVQFMLFYLNTSVSIADNSIVTTEFIEKAHSINTPNDKLNDSTLAPKLQNYKLEFGNSSTASTLSYGGILGTPAAYKLDVREPLIGCSLAEFACKNGRCIPASKYCDKVHDCGGGDTSDEPRFCTCKLVTII